MMSKNTLIHINVLLGLFTSYLIAGVLLATNLYYLYRTWLGILYFRHGFDASIHAFGLVLLTFILIGGMGVIAVGAWKATALSRQTIRKAWYCHLGGDPSLYKLYLSDRLRYETIAFRSRPKNR